MGALFRDAYHSESDEGMKFFKWCTLGRNIQGNYGTFMFPCKNEKIVLKLKWDNGCIGFSYKRTGATI